MAAETLKPLARNFTPRLLPLALPACPALQLIERVAALPGPKAVMLGNHDAWYSLTPSGRRRYTRALLQSSSMAAARQDHSEGTPLAVSLLQPLLQASASVLCGRACRLTSSDDRASAGDRSQHSQHATPARAPCLQLEVRPPSPASWSCWVPTTSGTAAGACPTWGSRCWGRGRLARVASSGAMWQVCVCVGGGGWKP